MLDIISTYSPETITTLRTLREAVILELAKTEDPKKLLSFLSKCCIASIQDDEKIIRIGVPNEFVVQQLKKFFQQSLLHAVHEVHAPGYKIEYITLPILQEEDGSPLQADLKSLLKIENKPKPKLEKSVKDELTDYFGILFEKKYTFDNFVVGANSQLAHAAAQAVAADPGKVYNPLFMYGNVGLGKTHLMQAIWNAIITNHPEKIVVYLPTSKFIDQVIYAIRHGHLGRLMEQLSQVDVLMLDDIQFLAGKDKTQEIFHNIFNEFTSLQKQIVLTSDQPPKSLILLEARLQSRFSLGLVVDIKAPDLETRRAILQMKLKQKGAELPDDVISFLAQHITHNIRELEWAINILLTQQQLLGETVDLSHAKQALQTIGISTAPVSTPTDSEQPFVATSTANQAEQFEDILHKIAPYFGVEPSAILGQSRIKELSQARQLAMYMAKTKFGRTLQRIGDYFGGRNHASVIYAIQICDQELQRQPQLRKFMQGL